MRVLVAVTLAAVAIGTLGAHADAGADATRLVGTVDSAANITLEDGDGTPVTTLAPGQYDLEVTDSTSSHNFHLTGPGVNESTSVGGEATVTWPLTLGDGNYHYVCDVHTSMFGHFTVVGASPPPPPPPPPPTPPPPPGPPPPGPPPPAPPAPPPPPPIEHPPPLPPPSAPALTGFGVRIAPGRVLVVSVRAREPVRALVELRGARGRLVQTKRVALAVGRNFVRMPLRRSVRAGRYLVVVRTASGRALSHRLRLR